MCKKWKIGGFLVLALLVGGVLMLPGTRQAAFGGPRDDAKSAGPAHYTVVMTEGHNLFVTDNAGNKLYFYEMMTLEPLFAGNDYQHLLRQILNERAQAAARFGPADAAGAGNDRPQGG
jgi:hypothetical protein